MASAYLFAMLAVRPSKSREVALIANPEFEAGRVAGHRARRRSLATRITSAAVLRQVSLDLVRTVFPPAQGVRLVGVAVSNFGDNQVAAPEQLDLVLTA
jgi:hypothetical protein